MKTTDYQLIASVRFTRLLLKIMVIKWHLLKKKHLVISEKEQVMF